MTDHPRRRASDISGGCEFCPDHDEHDEVIRQNTMAIDRYDTTWRNVKYISGAFLVLASALLGMAKWQINDTLQSVRGDLKEIKGYMGAASIADARYDEQLSDVKRRLEHLEAQRK